MWGGNTGGNQTVILREKVSRQEILQANMLELQMSFLVMPSSHQEIQDGTVKVQFSIHWFYWKYLLH